MIVASIVLLFAVATAALGSLELSVSRPAPSNVTVIRQDVPVNGTIAKKATLNFYLNNTKELALLCFWIQADAVVEGGGIET